ncbi:unnamed protein product, partial [Notodromas monacha]
MDVDLLLQAIDSCSPGFIPNPDFRTRNTGKTQVGPDPRVGWPSVGPHMSPRLHDAKLHLSLLAAGRCFEFLNHTARPSRQSVHIVQRSLHLRQKQTLLLSLLQKSIVNFCKAIVRPGSQRLLQNQPGIIISSQGQVGDNQSPENSPGQFIRHVRPQGDGFRHDSNGLIQQSIALLVEGQAGLQKNKEKEKRIQKKQPKQTIQILKDRFMFDNVLLNLRKNVVNNLRFFNRNMLNFYVFQRLNMLLRNFFRRKQQQREKPAHLRQTVQNEHQGVQVLIWTRSHQRGSSRAQLQAQAQEGLWSQTEFAAQNEPLLAKAGDYFPLLLLLHRRRVMHEANDRPRAPFAKDSKDTNKKGNKQCQEDNSTTHGSTSVPMMIIVNF